MSITRGIIVTSPRPSEWVKKSRPTYRVPGVAASVGHPDVGSGARRGPLLAAARPASVLARRERGRVRIPERRLPLRDGAHLLPDLHVHQPLRVHLRQDGEDVAGVAVLDRVDDVGDRYRG